VLQSFGVKTITKHFALIKDLGNAYMVAPENIKQVRGPDAFCAAIGRYFFYPIRMVKGPSPMSYWGDRVVFLWAVLTLALPRCFRL
jgi:hypothetical protein